ncbi:MAG: hypothetical protein SVN78_01290 [Deferribacterota bacterium]|nr:hypothetical protein [Deferribacterota bacterium]
MKRGIFAIINIGASAFRMLVCEYLNGQERLLEYMIKPLSLGKDTFTKGYISLDNVNKATVILRNFKHKLDEYHIGKNYRALCTSGVREARNRYFFIDHIKVNTGIELNVLEPSDEIYIKYVGVKGKLKAFKEMEKKGLLFANVSSGNVSISIHKNNVMVYSAALPYGNLRLNEIFQYISVVNRYKAYQHYVANMFYTIKNALPSKFSFQYVVCSGSSINLLLEVLKPKGDFFKKKDLMKIYDDIKTIAVDDVVRLYNMRRLDAEILLPTLTTYINMLSFTGLNEIHFTRVNFPAMLSGFFTNILRDGGLNNRLRKTFFYIGARFNFDKNHAKIVTKFALNIFDNIKAIHSLKNKERFLLEAASIMHEVGYFINARDHEEHSYHIIKSLSMPGLSKESINIIALISLLHRDNPYISHEDKLYDLNISERLIVYKLASILKIADSLDASHKNIVSDIDVIQGDGRLKIVARSWTHPFLEELAFSKKSKLFLENYGIKPELEIKIDYE